ncbi:MAG TPA: hypothetical protein VL486_16040 [Verrucomicrobiae bacterium]|nr:hypothetical protein [Verrucomicrobiae bacterium]
MSRATFHKYFELVRFSHTVFALPFALASASDHAAISFAEKLPTGFRYVQDWVK